MSIGRFILSVVVAYIVYAVLYMATMMGAFSDLFMANVSLMRAPDDSLMPFAYLAHLVQTIAVVWLFDKAVGSNDVKAGAIFGLWVGVYLAATDSTYYAGMKMATEPWAMAMVIHLAVGAIVGAVLALLYKGSEPEAVEE